MQTCDKAKYPQEIKTEKANKNDDMHWKNTSIVGVSNTIFPTGAFNPNPSNSHPNYLISNRSNTYDHDRGVVKLGTKELFLNKCFKHLGSGFDIRY